MRKIINNIFNKVKNISSEYRKDCVNEVAESIIDTLTKQQLNGSSLSATELSFVVNKVHSSVYSFLAEKQIETEELLENIKEGLNQLDK